MQPKNILIVDDDHDLVHALTIRCQSLGLLVRSSPDPLHAASEICWVRPDLVIMDVSMPMTDGLTLCERLARDGHLDKTPVVVLTGRTDDEVAQRVKALGAHLLIKGSHVWAALRPIIERHVLAGESGGVADGHAATDGATAGFNAMSELTEGLSESGTTKREAAAPLGIGERKRRPKVLAIDDDPAVSHALKVRLNARGVDVVRAQAGMEGYWLALQEQPDVIITDFMMPDGYGNYVMERLKNHPLTAYTPVIMVSGHGGFGRGDPGLAREMLRLGAAAYLPKPVDFGELCRILSQYIELQPVPERHSAGGSPRTPIFADA